MTNRCPVVSLHLLEPDNGKRCGELKLIKLRKHFAVAADCGECLKASQPKSGPVLNASPSSVKPRVPDMGMFSLCCWIISDI